MYDGDRGKDCPEEVAKVRSMLDGRLGVPVARAERIGEFWNYPQSRTFASC
jgi:hypothetical protein